MRIPKHCTRPKSRMEEPPITARITHTNKVVREVTMVRLKHWFKERLMVSPKFAEP